MMVTPAAAQTQSVNTDNELSQYNSQISQVITLFLDTYGDPELFETVAESRLYSDVRDQEKIVSQLQDTYNACTPENKQKIRQLFSESVALLMGKEPGFDIPSAEQLTAVAMQHEFDFIDVFNVPTPLELEEFERKMTSGVPKSLPRG